MKIALITDAWKPQINGVVTTLVELVSELELLGHRVEVIHCGLFKTRPCPGYAGIDLAVRPKALLTEMLDAFQADAIHIATEGPLGWAARSYCLKRGLRFTTAFHTKYPEILQAALKVPLSWGYTLFRHFHKPSAGVMVPTNGVLEMLSQRGFSNLRSWTHVVDTSLFEFQPQARLYPPMGPLIRPLSLFLWADCPMRKTSMLFWSWIFRAPRWYAVWGHYRPRSGSAFRRFAGWVCWRGPSWPGSTRQLTFLCFQVAPKHSAW